MPETLSAFEPRQYTRSQPLCCPGPRAWLACAVPVVAFVLGLFLMPETRRISIWTPYEEPARR